MNCLSRVTTEHFVIICSMFMTDLDKDSYDDDPDRTTEDSKSFHL